MEKREFSKDNGIEIAEARKQELLKRQSVCKDQKELILIEEQIKQIDNLLKKLQKISKTKTPK